MFSFNLDKTLPLIFFPLGFSLMLLMAAIKWRKRILIALPLAVLGLLSTPILANIILGSLENRYPYRSVEDCPKSDAVFVFGGMLDLRDRGDGSIAWNDAAERFDRAIRIMKAGKANLLVLSGAAVRYPGAGNEGELLKQEALARGIPAPSLIVTATSNNTKSEAADICQLALEKRWKRVLLVTSAYHMPRAMRLTESCPIERFPVPVAYRTPDPSTFWAQRRLESYMPQSRALFESELALHEYLGMFLLPN